MSIDVKKNLFGQYRVFTANGSLNTGMDPVTYAQMAQDAGAGEIFLNSIDRDGTFEGYDGALLKRVCESVQIPVVACGGAATVDDFSKAVLDNNASAVAAGSLFVFQRPHRAVLISYPKQSELKEKLFSKL